jgi:hypothetical protein
MKKTDFTGARFRRLTYGDHGDYSFNELMSTRPQPSAVSLMSYIHTF